MAIGLINFIFGEKGFVLGSNLEEPTRETVESPQDEADMNPESNDKDD